MSTIRDVARKAGVSVSTASLALNNDQHVRPETRKRVLDVAESLDYHPLRAAKSLSKGRTWAIQLINPAPDAALTSGFFTRFAQGVHDLAKKQHYNVALSILEDETEALQVTKQLIRERWTDGVVVMNPSDNDALLEQLALSGFPHVVLGRSASAVGSSVDNDNHAVAFDATMHLLSAGLGPVLLLNGPTRHTFTHERADGYKQAHRQFGVPVEAGLILAIEGTAEAARRKVRSLMEETPAFRSIVTVSDAQALGAMRAVQEAGFSVPDGVAIVGMNNDDITEYTFPRLSSVELNAYELGKAATELLLRRIEGAVSRPERRIIPHSLVVRESSAPRQAPVETRRRSLS